MSDEHCRILQVRVNICDGTPSAKAIKPEVRRIIDKLIGKVEARVALWDEYDYALLSQKEEMVQMQRSMGSSTEFPLQFGKSTQKRATRTDVSVTLAQQRKRPHKHKHRANRNGEKTITSASFSSGQLVMAWLDSMYYPAQILSSQCDVDNHAWCHWVSFIGSSVQQLVPEQWCMEIPQEYLQTVDLSAYLPINQDESLSQSINNDNNDATSDNNSEREVSMDTDNNVSNVQSNTEAAVITAAVEYAIEANGAHDAACEAAAESDGEDDMQKPLEDILDKYWDQRYRYFSKYDAGIQMDLEGWYSVTPELISLYIACRCAGASVLDCFAGVGGNVITLAQTCAHVCACDINEQRLRLAQHNARIYGVAHRIEWLCVDSISLLRSFAVMRHSFDVCLLSPPWGGPDYLQQPNFRLQNIQLSSFPSSSMDRDMCNSTNGFDLLTMAFEVFENVICLLPRNTSLKDLKTVAAKGKRVFRRCLVEDICLHNKHKMRLVYFGPRFVRNSAS